jgi:hypothetical protein
MRIELILLLITAGIVANIYYDGKLIKMALANKKYYKMGGVILGAIVFYVMIKKFPDRARNMLSKSNDYLKYMPIDGETAGYISPILDFTAKQNIYGDSAYSNFPILGTNGGGFRGEERILTSGGTPVQMMSDQFGPNGVKKTKRSVSETKKKYVASRQDWKCGECGRKLPAWFEVDHKVRLEYGGSNHIDNLVALCRDCHGKKTTIENL